MSWTASNTGMELGGHVVPDELERGGYLGHAQQALHLELCNPVAILLHETFCKKVK